MGEIVPQKIGQLYEAIQQKISADEDAQVVLDSAEKKPESKGRSMALAEVAEEKMNDDDGFAELINKLVSDIQSEEAEDIIQRAKVESRSLLESAREDARKMRHSALENFEKRRTEELERHTSEAIEEADKIKRDGIDLARGLGGRVKTRIRKAVDEAMETLFDG